MSRYSLRATPKKQELFEGMVHTPARRRSARSTSKPPTDSDSIMGDSSSEAAESGPSRPRRRRRPIKQEDDEENVTLREDVGQEEEEERKDRELEVKKEAREEERRADKVKKIRAVDGYVPGQDPRVDQTGEFEFGGSLGALAMMIGFPLLMWYMWIGATYYGGHLPAREPGQPWSDFGRHLARLVYEGAFPSARAFGIYWAFFLFEMACYCTLPGVWAYGKPLPHEGGRQLRYFCNAYASLYFTAAVAAGLHFSGLFPLQTVLDEFGPLLSAAIASSYAVSLVQYVSAVARGRTHRMTGYPIYDFFMGAELNPRLFGLFDFKMFVEVRIPWYMLLCITAAAAARQYERYGRVAPEVIFLALAHYLYANACSKGEELIVTTWDIYYEKSGFMYTFWTMAGVPLSYCHCTLYLANHDPAEYRLPTGALAGLCVAYAFWYWVWDSANSQKNRFRASERGQLVFRRTFPQLPWQTLHDPRVLVTPEGYTILADGWYGLARKIHYTADAFFALSWAVVCGFRSPFPWFYPLFFTCMIIHRASRDIHKCRTKYGEQWKEYERLVPYLFIPYVF